MNTYWMLVMKLCGEEARADAANAADAHWLIERGSGRIVAHVSSGSGHYSAAAKAAKNRILAYAPQMFNYIVERMFDEDEYATDMLNEMFAEDAGALNMLNELAPGWKFPFPDYARLLPERKGE